MNIYLSVPYAESNRDSKNRAIELFNKHATPMYRVSGVVVVNALNNWYSEDSLRNLGVYVHTLMQSAERHMVLRIPGWEYSDIIVAETIVAQMYKVPTVYLDPETGNITLI